MANIQNFNVISSGDSVLATVVSKNFSYIEQVLNSNGLDSDNYGVSTVLSQHVRTNAILSQHISDNAVVAAKITAGAIIHSKLNLSSVSDGVRVLQVGAAASDMPAGGVMHARMTQTFATGASTGTQGFTFSDAIDGDPVFTADPQPGYPMFEVGASTDSGPIAMNLTGLNSLTAGFSYVWSAADAAAPTATVHLVVAGPI